MISKIKKTLLPCLVLLLIAAAALDLQHARLSDKLIRLHVVANSDSEADQDAKLKVRDSVVSALDKLLAGAETKDEAEKIISENLGEINSAAENTLVGLGCAYGVRSEMKTEPFPTRGYDTFSLPAGYYTALRVTIGDGGGKNWWCVVYPKLCTERAAEKADFEKLGMTEDEAGLVTQNGGYVIKFRLMELIEKAKIALFG